MRKEKKRYEIHIYDDICVDLYDNGVLDKSINDTYKLEELLNQQSKRIKELGQENQQLKHQLAESEKPKEIRFNGFVVDCNYNEARKVLQENLFKMQAENKKLKESEELSNYAKCILKNKKLEEDIELSKKCCVGYEQEIRELKKQLRDLPNKIIEEINEELHDCKRTYIEDEPYIEICIVKGILAKIYRKY